MVHKHEVQGRIYRFKPQSTCLELGIVEDGITTIPSRIRSNLVLVLDTVKGWKDYVEIMAVRFLYLPSLNFPRLTPQ